MDAAKSIFHTYIEKNSALLIKLTHKTSISCTSNIRSSGTLHPFSSAVSEVFCMLEQDFQTFKRSSEWKMMEEKLGKSAAVRNQVTTKETCNWLLKLFEKNYTTPNLLFTNILMANEVPTPPLPLEMEETGDDASSIASSSAISSIAPSAEPVSIDEGGNGGFPPVSISRPGFDVYRSAVKDNLRIFLANLKR